MPDWCLDDLVLLHLRECLPGSDHDRSSVGIATALRLSESMAARVSLLSALTSLENDGTLETSAAAVTGLAGDRTVYHLTDAGRRRANELHDRVSDESIRVHVDGDRREHRLGELPGRYDLSLVDALSMRSPDGDLYLDGALEPAFVGRQDEQERLTELFSAARAERPAVAAITGEAGIGKTALVDRLLADARSMEVDVLVGRCRREGGVPYHPLREAFDGVTDRRNAGAVPFDTDRPAPSTAEMYETQVTALFSEIITWLRERSTERPQLLVLEDLQWADAATLELLGYVRDRLEASAVCVIWSCRSAPLRTDDRLAALLDDVVHIELGPLERAAVTDLVERHVGRRGVPASFIDAVIERTGGNPLFVIEAVRALLEAGTLDPDHDSYPDDCEEIVLPEAARSTIRRQLEHLAPNTRSVLERGAVIGDHVSIAVLAATSDRSEPRVREHVDVLVEGGVWRREGDSVRFVSEELRSTVYEGIERARRRRLHRRIATAINEGATTQPHAAVAHHAWRGGEDSLAIDHLLAAGESARGVYAYDTAIEHYGEALALARETEREPIVLETLEALGDIYYTRGEYEAADKRFRYIREQTTDPERVRRTYRYQARMRFERGEYEDTERYASAGLAVGNGSVTTERCWLQDYLAGSQMKRGRLEEAIDGFRTQRTLATRIDDSLLLGRAHQNLGTCYLRRGAVSRAVESLECGIDLLEEAGDDRELARCLNDLAIAYEAAGTYDAATATLERCYELAEATGNVRPAFLALNNLGVFAQFRGEWDEARSYCERVQSLSDRVDNQEYAAFADTNAGIIATAVGTLDTAIEDVDRSLEWTREHDQQYLVVQQLLTRGSLLCLRAEFDPAERAIRDGLEIARTREFEQWIAAGERGLGVIRRERGRLEKALVLQRRALERAEEVGNDRHLGEHRWQFGETLVRADRPDEALEQARCVETELSSSYRVARLQATVTRGAAHRGRGEFDAARNALEAVLEESGPCPTEATLRTRRELGFIALERGAASAARTQFEAGRSLAAASGATLYERRFDDRLETIEQPRIESS